MLSSEWFFIKLPSSVQQLSFYLQTITKLLDRASVILILYHIICRNWQLHIQIHCLISGQFNRGDLAEPVLCVKYYTGCEGKKERWTNRSPFFKVHIMFIWFNRKLPPVYHGASKRRDYIPQTIFPEELSSTFGALRIEHILSQRKYPNNIAILIKS